MAETILNRFCRWVAERGDATAVVCGHESATYRQLDDRARLLAGRLVGSGVAPGDLVGLHFDRSLEFVVAVLAVLHAGATYVPLGTDWPADRVAFLAEDAGLRLILSQAPDGPAFGKVKCPVLGPARGQEESTSRIPVLEGVEPLQAAYVMFTSGSTGRPKGVIIPQKGILRLCAGDYLPWGPDLRFLLLAPTSFDASTLELWGPLLHGGTCVIHPEPKVTLEGLRKVLAESRISCLWLTAGLFNQVLDEDPTLLAPVRYVMTGGEALSVTHVRKALALLPDTEFINGYGPTEATTFTTTYRIPRNVELGASVPIGRPLVRTVCRILDEQGHPVAPGDTGELYIGGDGVADGYLNRPELTRERFVPDRWSGSSGGRLYRSGDLVRELPDGNLDFVGRIDDQVKVRGFRIEPGEIEAALVEIRGVRRAAVMARTGRDGVRELAAYLVVDPDARLSVGALRQDLLGRLPAYLVPEFFGVVESLPLTPNGKLDRARLMATAAGDLPAETESPAAPRTPLEAGLAELWARELGRPVVGIHDRFMDLGGNSLRALRLVARIRERWGRPVKLAEFLARPTVAGLAELLESGSTETSADRIVPVRRDGPIPLTGELMGLWFLDQQGQDPATHHVTFAWRMSGPLDRERLNRAWHQVVQRHEALRSQVVLVEGVPHHQPARDGCWDITWMDLGAETSTPEALGQRLEAEARVLIPLDRAPVWRFLAMRLGETEHVLQLVIQHLFIDEWSLRIVLEELAAFYAAGPDGVPDLSPVRLQFGDYSVWHERRMKDPSRDADRRFWKESLAGAPTALELPFDLPEPMRRTGGGRRLLFQVPADVRQAMESLGAQVESTPFVTALAAFHVLLSRWSGEEDMVIGSPMAQREEPGLERVVGCFLNTLPIRLSLDPSRSVLATVGAVREAVARAFQHGFLSLSEIVRASGVVSRDASVPLFNVMFVLLDEPWPGLALAGLRQEMLEVETRTSKVDLTVLLTRGSAGGWRAELEYNTDRFSGVAARALAEQMTGFFRSFAEDPNRVVRDLELIPASAARALVDRLSPPVAVPKELPFDRQFLAQAGATPDRLALRVGSREWTYAQVAGVAGQMAGALRQAGVKVDDRVALLLGRDERLPVSILGVLLSGGGYVPLDPEAPEERILGLITEARPRLLVTSRDRAGIVSKSPVRVLWVEDLVGTLETRAPAGVEPVARPESLAYLIFTSGSTGRPKGVEIEHRQLMSLFRAMDTMVSTDPSRRWLATTNYTFDISVFELLWPLLHGQAVVFFQGDAKDQSIPRRIRECGVTHFQCTPSRAEALLLDREAAGALGLLKAFISTGEPLPTPLAIRLAAVLKGPLIDLYGPTETTIWSTGAVLPPPGDDVHIGRPLANTRVAVVDEQLRPIPTGLVGELLIGGAGVARGYWDQPALTAERFVIPTFATDPAERWYRTGDRVRWRRDGNLDYLGRRDAQVKLRGYRIELGEIEAALKTHPAVHQAVVSLWREPGCDPELVAYLVCSPAGRVEPAQLRRHLAARLSPWLVPTQWMWLNELPLTPSGKVNRRALPAPEREEAPVGEVAVEARTETERTLVELWKAQLGRHVVGIHDEFFSLGGHSLLALRLVAAISAAFGRTVTIGDLLSHPTVAQLASLLEPAAQIPEAPRPVPFRGDGAGAPVFHIPGLFGYGFLAPPLGEVLGRYHPYYDGLQFPGADGQTAPLTRLEDIAADMVRQIAGVYPSGPLWLTGNSFGGLVAFETAQQLTRSGRTVEGLLLFDTILGDGVRRRSYPEFILTVLRRIWAQKRGERIAFARRLVRAKYGIGGWLGDEREIVPERNANTRVSEALIQANYNAAARYVPTRYGGRVILLQATVLSGNMFLRNAPDSTNGWGSLLTGDFTIHPIACQHMELFKEPIHPEVCGRLEEILKQESKRRP